MVPLRHVGVLIAGVLLAAGLSGVAAADPPPTLFVGADPGVSDGCSASGPGTMFQPFCTPQEAANVVLPGQTVEIGPAPISGESGLPPGFPGFTLTRSGTPDAPIVFTSAPSTTQPLQHLTGAVVLSGVQDVTLENVAMQGTPATVTVTNSSDITINHVDAISMDIGGASHDVTVTRSDLNGLPDNGPSILVDQGDDNVVLSDDAIDGTSTHVQVTGATNTVLVNNTTFSTGSCAAAVSVSGGATGTVIENNVISGCFGQSEGISVAADSTSGSIVDYNDVFPGGSDPAYSWAGTGYADAAAFTAATGQGAHDLNVDPGANTEPPEGSPLIDSADANAPDVPPVDALGNPRVDDPLVPNTGTGAGDVDRGAFERQDPIQVAFTMPQTQAPTGGTVTANVTASTAWGTITGYTADFGDGTPVVTSATPALQHVYTTTGQFTVRVTATDNLGHTSLQSAPRQITVVAPAPLTLHTELSALGALDVAVDNTVTDSWNLTGGSIDYGDGSPKAGLGETQHVYPRVGTYTVTVVEQDSGGNSVTSTGQITTAGVRFTAFGPNRVLDTRNTTGGSHGPVAPGATVRLQIAGANTIPADVTAVALNLTATDTSGPGFVVAFPDGAAQPDSSTVNFTAGQTVANTTIVPVGADGDIDLFVHGSFADLVGDVTGYFTSDPTASGYTVTGPARLLDTRTTGAPVPDQGMVSVPVDGVGDLPDTGVVAAAVNITVVNPTTSGFVQAFPEGAIRPITSSVNFVAGDTTANMAIVPVGRDGAIDIFNKSGGPTDVLVDIVGYFTADGAGEYVPKGPLRLFDTRSTGAPLLPRTPTTEPVALILGDATAYVLNTTVTDTTTPGFLTVYGQDDTLPTASDMNWNAGQTVANMTIPAASDNSFFNAYNGSGTNVDLIGDLLGYFGTS